MRLLRSDLKSFLPQLSLTNQQIVQTLTSLGFEAVQVGSGIFDITVTPNRGDAMSAYGIARELSAWLRRDEPAGTVVVAGDTKVFEKLPVVTVPTITIAAASAVTGYEAVVFSEVTVGPSPDWLKKAVIKLGWRSINTIVDLTNYLMDRLGQPLHAFDLDAILGKQLTVRFSKAGETIRTLDDVDRVLPADLLVAQDSDSLIDLVGVMGAANTEIHPQTKRVLLHAVALDPLVVRRATKATGLRTQAAIRYERGTDSAVSRPTLNQAIQLMKRMNAGQPVGHVEVAVKQPQPPRITVRPQNVQQLLGVSVTADRQAELLGFIGCQVEVTKSELRVTAPSWRHDLEIWQDCAEEVARLIGLNDAIPAVPLPARSRPHEPSLIEWAEALKDQLIELGLNEVQTYSFVSKAQLDVFELPMVGELANPLNPTLRYLRPSLVPGLAAVAAANQSFDPTLVFEIGHVFTANTEEVRLGIGLVGRTDAIESWLVRLADQLGIDSGQLRDAALMINMTDDQRATLKIRKNRATFIEFKLADLQSGRRIPATYELPTGTIQYRSVSRFPAVSRDIAFLVSREVPADQMSTFARSFDQWIEAVELFDEFESPKLGANVKSLAFHVRYADPTRTLTESDIAELHERLVSAIERTFNANRR